MMGMIRQRQSNKTQLEIHSIEKCDHFTFLSGKTLFDSRPIRVDNQNYHSHTIKIGTRNECNNPTKAQTKAL